MIPASLLFVWTNAAASLFAWRVGRRFLPAADAATRVLVAVLTYVALAELALLGLHAVGLLGAFPLAVLVTVLLVGEGLAPSRGATPVASSSAAAVRRRPPATTWVPVALVVGLVLSWAAAVVGRGVHFTWDDLTYHAAVPAWWLQNGTLGLPPFGYQVYYPLAAELLTLWFQLPLASDAYANLVVLAWLALALAATASLGRELGHPAAATAGVLACLLISPEVVFFRSTFSANDLAVAGLGLATLALCGRAPGLGGRFGGLACGLAAGLAVSTKVSALPLVALVALFRLDRLRRGEESRASLACFGLGLVLTGTFWYARNLIVTGNPLFPAELGPFEGPFDAAAQRKTSLLPTLVAEGGRAGFWLELARRRLDWPLPIGLVAAGGYVSGAWAALRAGATHRRRLLLLILACGAALLLLFPLQPFSGTTNRPDSELIDLPRYLASPFLVGLVLFPASAGARSGPVLALVALLAASSAAPSVGGAGAAWILLGLALVAAWVRWGDRFESRRGVAVLFVCLWGALALEAGDAEARATRNLYGFPETWAMWAPREEPGTHPVGRGFELIEELPPGSRVAWIANLPSSHAFTYPLFGRARQYRVVPVSVDGRAREPLHRAWRQDPPGWWWEFDLLEQAVPAARLRKRLRAAGVDYLVVSKWPKSAARRRGWPPAREALVEGLGLGRRLAHDGYTEVWDVRAPDGGSPRDGAASGDGGDRE